MANKSDNILVGKFVIIDTGNGVYQGVVREESNRGILVELADFIMGVLNGSHTFVPSENYSKCVFFTCADDLNTYYANNAKLLYSIREKRNG